MPYLTTLENPIQLDQTLIQVNVLADTHKLLVESVEDISLSLSNQSITDALSGLSLSDLNYKLGIENKYRISILKEIVIKNALGRTNEVWYKGFVDDHLGKLEREKSSLERMIIVYEQAQIEFNQQQFKLTSSSNDQPGNNSGTTVNAPQYSKDVINQLLDLGSKMAEPEYKKSLLEEK